MGKRMAIEIEWPDGSVIGGTTPRRVLKRLAELQWDDYTPEQMADVLSDRAWKLRGAAIDPSLPLFDLFEEMENAGMCWIIRWEEAEN